MRALASLPEDQFQAVSEALPTELMEKLGRPDIGFCDPERMAQYLRNSFFQLHEIYKQEKKASLRVRGRGEESWKKGAQVETLASQRVILEDFVYDMLEIAGDRDRDIEEETDFLKKVAYHLINPETETKTVPAYILGVVKRLAEQSDFAGLLFQHLREECL